MLKRATALLVVLVAVALQGCVSALGGGLQSFSDSYDGYQFAYPTGWVEVSVNNGPDVVFHDIINPSENVSVIMSPVGDAKTLEDLGTPSEVGYKLSKNIMAVSGEDRDIELLNAKAINAEDKTYYILEYIAKVPSGVRHNLASAIVRRGKLYTFNASVPEARWEKLNILLKQSVASFSVY